MKCKNAPEFCSGQASEANGYCFLCAEEIAYLIYEASIEFGASPAKAAVNAQASWQTLSAAELLEGWEA